MAQPQRHGRTAGTTPRGRRRHATKPTAPCDMAEQGSTMLLDGLSAFLTDEASN
ncbi:hypothetical protein ACFW2D_01805 [Streptomyces sp. NPDC058914]|uniref:hypothetical protein n=1 Tax=Streptomyces TaxID=1883 RepID=UPI0036AF6FCC